MAKTSSPNPKSVFDPIKPSPYLAFDYGHLTNLRNDLMGPHEKLVKAGFRHVTTKPPGFAEDEAHGLLLERVGIPTGVPTQFWLNEETAEEVDDFLKAVAPDVYDQIKKSEEAAQG